MNESSPIEGQTSEPMSPFSQPGRSGTRKQVRRNSVRASAKEPSAREVSLPAPGTMYRTKKLIAAAIRVWELKRGLRD